MAYDREKVLEQCLKVIEDEKLTFFNDLAIYVEPTMATLYEWEFEKLETVKSALAKNRLSTKKKLRNKWEESDNATLQISAYKLIAEKEELNALTMNRQEIANPPGEKFEITLNLSK